MPWNFDPDTRTLTVGNVPCAACKYHDGEGIGKAKHFPMLDCPKCKGTGKRGNGKCRNCNVPSYGLSARKPGKVPDYANPYYEGDCRSCEGRVYVPARTHGTGNAEIPADIAEQIKAAIPFQVTARNGEMSWGEQHLGFGQVKTDAYEGKSRWSRVDYGRTWDTFRQAQANGTLKQAIDSLRDEVREQFEVDRVIEVCHRTSNDETQFRIIDRVMVVVGPDGYVVYTVTDAAVAV